MTLSDQELAALHSFRMYKSSYRAENLARVGVEYTPADPIIRSLIEKGFIKVQGKALIPDKDRIDKELENHDPPKSYPYLENAHLVFRRSRLDLDGVAPGHRLPRWMR